MFRTLIKTDAIAVEDQTIPVRYFQWRTLLGNPRYSAEILLKPQDRVALDDDSMTSLETRVVRLLPFTIFSRMLASDIT